MIIGVSVGNRNGLLQPLGAWIAQGLVLDNGLFLFLLLFGPGSPNSRIYIYIYIYKKKTWRGLLDHYIMYIKAYCTRIKGLGASRTIFQMSLMMGIS